MKFSAHQLGNPRVEQRRPTNAASAGAQTFGEFRFKCSKDADEMTLGGTTLRMQGESNFYRG
jgi:hypothetical protein